MKIVKHAPKTMFSNTSISYILQSDTGLNNGFDFFMLNNSLSFYVLMLAQINVYVNKK